MHLVWPEFDIGLSSQIANEAVSVLASLFSIYIIGHILAYIGSQAIEKTLDRFMGKISTSLIFATQWSSQNRNESIRALFYNRIKAINADKALFVTALRSLVHLPALPIYMAIWIIGIFSYYETRLTKPVIDAARVKLQTIGLGPIELTIKSKWYKPLEYFVVNRYPNSVPRMYNYLVISGLFRTLSLIFLLSMWASIYYIFHFYLDGEWFLEPLFNSAGPHTGLTEFAALSFLYAFCLFSYIKFQRRYAEEAIFAFVFGKD